MATLKKFRLVHDEARRGVAAFALNAPEGIEVVFKEPAKTRLQEEKYHAMLNDIAEQMEFCGRKWDAESIKRICIDQFKRDTINDPSFAQEWRDLGAIDVCPSLDGSGVVMLGVQSRRFPKRLAIGFIEWLYALGAERGIHWSEPKQRGAA